MFTAVDGFTLAAPPPPPRVRPASEAAGAATTAPSAVEGEGAVRDADASNTQTPGAATVTTAPAEEGPELFTPIPKSPLGFTGPSWGSHGIHKAHGRPMHQDDRGYAPQDDFLPLPDRWRVGLPGDYVQNARGGIFNPYRQNVLKGDYPILGDHIFFNLTAISDTLFEFRSFPLPTNVSAQDPNSFDFFGTEDSQLFNQNFIISLELFEGETFFKPRDWELRITTVINYNYVNFDEVGVVSPDPRDGSDRNDEIVALQDLFFEKHLLDLSPNYDFVALRGGIQGFNADFKGFLFIDNNLGLRLFGNYDNSRWLYNLAWFHQLEKDTNSGLNELTTRDQDVFIANLYREDFLVLGYTGQVSFAMNWDRGNLEYDSNGFLVRPQPIGTIAEKEVRAYYLGWAGDGHWGRLNLTHQFYQVFGTESFNQIADQETYLNAQFFAIELSVDIDWIRPRASFMYASGDDNPLDGTGGGFDSIFDNPNFAGGGFAFFQRQSIPLTGGGTFLNGRNSFLPNLRQSKEQGQANFVNPGLFLYNVGVDFDLTPRTRLFTNVSWLRFADTSSLELLLFDDKINPDIGIDISLGVQYRPFNTNNIIFTVGAAALVPGAGFQDIYTSETLYSTFVAATLTY